MGVTGLWMTIGTAQTRCPALGAGYHAAFPLVGVQLETSSVAKASVTVFWALVGVSMRSAAPQREVG